MKIEVNDKYYVDYDKYNFTPHKWSEGGEVLTGKHKGKVTESRWVTTSKHFGTLAAALRWITVEGIVDDNEVVSINEFLEKYEQRMKELVEACKGL